MTSRRSFGALAVCVVCCAASPARADAAVYAFPSPGSRLAPPGAQIAFRGLPVSRLGDVTVTGSRTGAHAGRLASDSDGLGGSFLPAKPFEPGEVVTVHAGVAVAGGAGGTFKFTVATPAHPVISHRPGGPKRRIAGEVMQFHSEPRLAPDAVQVVRRTSAASSQDIFLAPQGGFQTGPMILSPQGHLVWFEPVPADQGVDNFQVQAYRGEPVLTWWQGVQNREGWGRGIGVVHDSSYRQIASVRATAGLSADLHEFQITPRNTALISAYFPVVWDASAVGGGKQAYVLDGVVQEIDIPTGLLLFQWDSLDHVTLPESHVPLPDYFHINSIQETDAGQILVSARNTWAGYLIDHGSGRVIWRLGGKRSNFHIGPGASFAFQHDMRLWPSGVVTLFDDGAGPPHIHSQSRGLALALDTSHMTARLAYQYEHTPGLVANFEGNDEALPNGHSFIGWGQPPWFTEFDSHGQIVFDARFVAGETNYRALRAHWTATPATPPKVVVAGRTLYVSWNGTTATRAWTLLAGASATALRPVKRVGKLGFETAIAIPGRPRYVAVQALDGSGHVLATSPTVRAGTNLSK